MYYTPPPNTEPLVIYGKTVKVFTVDDLGMDNKKDAVVGVYLNQDKWTYLASRTFFEINGDLDTEEKTDEFIQSALDAINAAIKEKFVDKEEGAEPKNGVERIEFILGKLTVVNDKIVIDN